LDGAHREAVDIFNPEHLMAHRVALQGIRVNLSGAVPAGSTPTQCAEIESFVSKFAAAVFREGGTLVHGSHPTFQKPLEAAARPYVRAGGARDALTLVRAQEYATTPEQLAEMEFIREYAAVQVIPNIRSRFGVGAPQGLISMREWMADRCDVVVAVGGNHYDIGTGLAGVPQELEEMLSRGKAAFLAAGLGGAVAGYVKDHQATIFPRLRNGLAAPENRSIAESTDVGELVGRIISQIKLLPLVRESVPRGRLFRVLALDGGGLRGTFTAAVLAKWDDMLKSGGGNELVKHFDLVAGTSTGAILAIGLGLGLTPLEMLNFYKKEGPKIFPKDRKLRHWLKSKHESQTLRSTLESILGSRKLSEHSCCRLVIPTVRAIHGEAESIVTAHSPDRTAFSKTSAVDAALASSAAPTYFDEAVIDGTVAIETYLDGGVWANNPVLPAIAEAVRYLKVPLDRIDVLSVGTMGNETDFTESLGKGKLGWAPTSADLFFAAQEHAAATLADSFLGPARHLRVNQETPIEIKLDDTKAIEDMALRGSNVGQDAFVAVRSRFLDGLHAPDWRLEVP
jgi:patatin-like phospholipase/acyl hydrolase